MISNPTIEASGHRQR